MLGKLLKYELKGTARWFLPLYALLIVMAAVNRVFMEIRDSNFMVGMNNPNLESLRNLPVILATTFYVFIIAAVFIVTTVIIIQRFYKNLLGDEGYLMFTLPVQPWMNIVSKLIVAILWLFVSTVVTALSLAIIVVNEDFLYYLPDALESMHYVMTETGMNGMLFMWLMIANCVVGTIGGVLQIYGAIAIGQLSNNHKVLCAFGAYIGINMAVSTVSSVISVVTLVSPMGIFNDMFSYNYSPDAMNRMMNLSFGISLLLSVALAVAMFLVTNYLLTKKLNLE